MTNTAQVATRSRQMLNKVPEVTVYFWIIKILCTTVGESFADYINETLGFGLTKTTVVFSAGLATASRDPAAAKALIAYLSSPSAAPVIARSGMEPVAK